MTGDVLKIGVLVPLSSIYPNIGKSLLAGMNLHFARTEQKIQFIPEDVGFGQSIVEGKVHKLTGVDNVDLVVGIVSTGISALISDIFRARQTLFIGNSVGENILRNQEYSPFIFFNSLSHWQANWGLGSWAAQHLGRRAFIAMSFYDSGYDTPFAFQMGLRRAGGEVALTYMSHRPPDKGDFDPLFAYIKETQPDFVYAAYAGRYASDFVKAYAQSEFAGRIPLVGTGFIADDPLLAEQGSAALGIKTCLAWSDQLDTPEHRAFMNSYQAAYGHAPDPFALLGYETAHLISSALQATNGNLRNIEVAREALLTTTFTSPRGHLNVSVHTNTTTTPLYLREVRWQADMLKNVPIAQIDPVSDDDEVVRAIRDTLHSGWINAYLCV